MLLCQFFVLAGNRFWFYILLMYLEYHTVVVLCLFFWFWREIVLVLRTYLVYNTVVRLCQFFCCYGKANLVRLTLFYSTLLALYSQTERQTEKRIHSLPVGWRNLFSSCPIVSVFCSGGKKVLVLHTTYVLRVPYSCGVVFVFLVVVGKSFCCYIRT